MNDSMLYQRVQALIQDLQAQEQSEHERVARLVAFAESHPAGSREQECANVALAVARIHLRRTQLALRLALEARAAYEAREENDTEAFVGEWIVQHGITRGMPPRWNPGVR